MNKFTDFGKGFIAGFVLAVIIFGVILTLMYFNKRERTLGPKELVDYAKKQIEIEELREDYGNRDPVEFLEIPDVRRAADGAAAEFERKRDEALFRFRSKRTD